MHTPTQNTLGGRDASVGFSMPNSGFSPKGERKMYPGSMGNTSPFVKAGTNKIDRIEEENSDNEGEGAASLHIKKNNYDKNKKK
jgi:hypothetical protein